MAGLGFFASLILTSGCSRLLPTDALVVTQSPSVPGSHIPQDALEVRYPLGSRVVITTASLPAKPLRVLSIGLAAAAEPVVSCDGRRIIFAGKRTAGADWQIYEVSREGGLLWALTDVHGGATDPALLGDGTLIYVSPVPKLGVASNLASALYAQGPDGRGRQLTFTTANVADPTVLSDGRILFVATFSNSVPGSALYTINNDGTEITAFAGQHDGPSRLQRPRELDNGRVAFIAAPMSSQDTTAEFVLSARPFHSRGPLLPNVKTRIRSVQQGKLGEWLVCAEPETREVDAHRASAVFRVNAENGGLKSPFLADPEWDSIEAVPVAPSRRPMGRLSNIDLNHTTGQILCLNVNDTTVGSGHNHPAPKAKLLRIYTKSASNCRSILGEVEVQPDGSIMAEVPANMPLGFEALNDRGEVLRAEPPLIWLRPGENRSCIGCHEPHNHSPRNVRPLAVRVPVPRVTGEPGRFALAVPH